MLIESLSQHEAFLPTDPNTAHCECRADWVLALAAFGRIFFWERRPTCYSSHQLKQLEAWPKALSRSKLLPAGEPRGPLRSLCSLAATVRTQTTQDVGNERKKERTYGESNKKKLYWRVFLCRIILYWEWYGFYVQQYTHILLNGASMV